MIYVCDREAGNLIEKVASFEEGKEVIARYEESDKNDGTFTENFYDVVEKFEYTVIDVPGNIILETDDYNEAIDKAKQIELGVILDKYNNGIEW